MNLRNKNKIYDTPINITTERWLEILDDESLCNEKTLKILLHVFKSDNYKAYASKIAPELGYSHHAPLNAIIAHFAKYVLNEYSNLVPVCPNCHTMIHSKKEMFTLDEIKSLINRDKQSEEPLCIPKMTSL